MSNPKDYDKDFFGSESDLYSKRKKDDDLDELLRSIDREIGDAEPLNDPHLLDYDLYEDIFGSKEIAPKDVDRKTMVDDFSQETKVLPSRIGTAQRKTDREDKNALMDEAAPVKLYRNEKGRMKSEDRTDRKSDIKEQKNGQSVDKRRKGIRLSGPRYILFVFLVSLILAFAAWIFANDIFALNKPPVTATITVPENFTMYQVSTSLKKAGVIKYKWLFQLFGVVADADKKIDPGMYKLTSDLDYRAIVSQMQEGSSDEIVKITVPEGYTMDEIFAMLESKGVCPASKLKEYATNHDFDYKFLKDIPLGKEKRLEGYLFPDTYEFYLSESATDVIEKFLDNFDAKINADMYNQAKDLGYSMADVIKVASLIEKESANKSESANIASVIYNRLSSSKFPYLQIDATVQYILPQRKEKLTNEDLKIDNPYNTYQYKGLPPTAISNPGINSIKAALSPHNTNYYFYALNKKGDHSFFTNANDFDSFVNSADYGG
jgi:conserved hypothetical protein, YceG family